MATRHPARGQRRATADVPPRSGSGGGGAASPSSSTASSSQPPPGPASDCASSPASKPHSFSGDALAFESDASKENITVTVRFRPLSPREIRQGEAIAWYAGGENIVQSEHASSSLAYAFDRVFGPTTTTRHVYDVAAQHVVNGAMEGINGTIFAYGVTSSGKTHTMHGDQRSPGIIPLAVKDAFSTIQETPDREFLLRVSYLEIYNEVVNDLLNPSGQNLRIREDHQGTFVEGIKEEVVLSPAHALSLIAAGEEHRHVGATNFNLLSSRSHTIFTLTIESSPCGESSESVEVNFSQLNLIDLAGSESSRAETTGVRRKEGSYINRSLLTLGTVISKLTDGKAMHIPYRDSKLTRLLQSSLSGQARVSLICTVTPASSNSEETHNTLKFAHRAKHIEIQASQNKIMDEKSLIKKYQTEIRSLKEELEQLKRGIAPAAPFKDIGKDDIVLLKKKLEDGHVKLQTRLEQEEDAKAILMTRIQRLTKLILVSTKATQPSRFPQRPGLRRRHSFGEEELSYLPHRRRDMILDENDDCFVPLEGDCENNNDTSKFEKRNRKQGLLNWFKLRKRDSGVSTFTISDGEKSSGAKSVNTATQAENGYCNTKQSNSSCLHTDNLPAEQLLDVIHERDLPSRSFLLEETPLTTVKTVDQVELLREQLKILSGEVALHTSVLKRLSDEAKNSLNNDRIQVEIQKVNSEIKMKNQQIALLEKQMTNSISANKSKIDKSYDDLVSQLNEKSFELEVKTADNRIIQDQLNQKICECEKLQETVDSLRQQLKQASQSRDPFLSSGMEVADSEAPKDITLHLIKQAEMANEIEDQNQKILELSELKAHLEAQNQKLVEESTYAKGLASAAGVELKALSEEVTKLMNQNERLAGELASTRNLAPRRMNNVTKCSKRDSHIRRYDPVSNKEANASHEREFELEAALTEKEHKEVELQKKVEESKQREAFLESELSNMWLLVGKLKKPQVTGPNGSDPR